jgi:hypothetical protein
VAAVVAAAHDGTEIVSFAYQPPTLSELFFRLPTAATTARNMGGKGGDRHPSIDGRRVPLPHPLATRAEAIHGHLDGDGPGGRQHGGVGDLPASSVPGRRGFGLWIEFSVGVGLHRYRGDGCSALVFANLGRAYPKTGGPYVYARRAFGDFAGFWKAWGVVAIGVGASETCHVEE